MRFHLPRTNERVNVEEVLKRAALQLFSRNYRVESKCDTDKNPEFARWCVPVTAFVIALAIALIVFAFLGIVPFGDKTLLVSDMYSQYSCFFGDTKSLAADGLFYSLKKSLGGDMYSLAAYYMMSPLNLIFLFLPLELLPEAVSILYILKLSLAAFTMSLYLSNRQKRACSDSLAYSAGIVVFSLAWSFSAYFTLYSINIMWLDALTLLPLITLGIDRLVKSKRTTLYTLSLAGAIFCNYYIGYMLCIFSVLYFLYSQFCRERGIYDILGAAARFAVSSLLAGGMTAVVLIPVGLSMQDGKVEPPDFMSPEYVQVYLLILSAAAAIVLWEVFSRYTAAANRADGKELVTGGRFGQSWVGVLLLGFALAATGAHFYILIGCDKSFALNELVSRLFVGASDAVDYAAGLPNIYCGLGTAMLAVGFYANRLISPRERIAHGLLLASLVVSCFVSPLNLIWHLFNPPTWFGYRYSFMISFVIIIAAHRLFAVRLERASEEGRQGVIRTAVGIGILFFLSASLSLAGIGRFTKPIIILNFVLIAAYVLFMILVESHRRLAVGIFALMFCGELALSGGLTLDSVSDCYGDVSSAAALREFVAENQPRLEAVETLSQKGGNMEFYRCELLEPRSFNDSLLLGYNGISHYSSSMKLSDAIFLQRLGFPADRAYASYNGGASLAVDSLLGVRYLFGDCCARADGELLCEVSPEELTYAESFDASEDALGVYENTAALGIAIPVLSDELLELSLTGIPLDNIESIYSALLGEEITLFEPVDYETSDRSDKIELEFTGDGRPVVMFAELPRLQYARLFVNGEPRGGVFDGYTQGIISLGYFDEGEPVKVELESDYPLEITALHICSEDTEALRLAVDRLGGVRTEVSGSKLTIKLNDNISRNLLLTLPYSKGLRIYADGEPLADGDICEVLDALTLLRLPEGTEVVTVSYRPVGFIAGAAVSIVSLLLTVGCCVAFKFARHKNSSES